MTVWLCEPVVKVTVVSLALKEVIVGLTLSIYLLVIVILSVVELPVVSVTVKVTEPLCEVNEEGLEYALVKVYVFPLTLVCVAPVTATLDIATSSLTTAVNVIVLLDASFCEAYQVGDVLLAENEVIVGATLSVFVIFTVTLSDEEFPAESVTVNVKESLDEPKE